MPQSDLLAQDAILKHLQDHKFALDQSAIVAQTDSFGSITYVNHKFCEISEYSANELLGKNHRIINSGTHSKVFFEGMWRTILSGQIWRGEICNQAKSGRKYWVYTTIVPFLDNNGRPNQFLSIRQDITELKEAQKTIHEQQSQMIASSKLSAIGEMAATITHEINNPLGVILGRCEMIKGLLLQPDCDLKTLSRLVDTIEVTAKRIERIVKSMKTLSYEGEAEPFFLTSANTIVSDLVELFSEKFQSHGIQLIVSPFGRDVCFECRSHEVMQVLVNLFNNAFDAISDREERWVRLDVQSDKEQVRISVTDSGHGISNQVVEKIFMPFFSTKKIRYGTGLGLSISRSLIQRHQGRLEYDHSSPFTRFVVIVPLKQN